jgi:hypothetical protein
MIISPSDMSSSTTSNHGSSSSAANAANTSLNGGGDNATEAAADDDSLLPNVVSNSLFAKTKSAYESAPLAYAAGATAINWAGKLEPRQKVIARVEEAFKDVDIADEWSPEGTKAYKHLLNKFYSVGALRLLCAVHDLEVVNTTGRKGLVKALSDAKTQLCSPTYLQAFYKHYEDIMDGECEGQDHACLRMCSYTMSCCIPYRRASCWCKPHTHS